MSVIKHGRFGWIDDDEDFDLHSSAPEARKPRSQNLTSPSAHLDALTRQEMDQFPELSYRQALQRVQDRNPEIVRLHASETNGAVRTYASSDDGESGSDVSALIDSKAKALLDSDPEREIYKTYSDAVQHVLGKSPALAAKYRDYTSDAGYRRTG